MTAPEVVHGLVVRPGDTLLIVASRHMNDADEDEFVATLREGIGDDVKIAIFNGVDQLAVYRPDEVSEAT